MSKVRYSFAFFDSMNEYSGNGERLSGRVGQFVDWKESGKEPARPFKDKSSAKNDRGEVFRPYQRAQVRHCHCGFFPNGDPLIAYRIRPDGSILIIAITHHHEMFNPQARENFLQKYKSAFDEGIIPSMRNIIALIESIDDIDEHQN